MRHKPLYCLVCPFSPPPPPLFPPSPPPPVLPWGLYLLDKLREAVFHTYRAELAVRPVLGGDPAPTSLIHTDASGKPTSMKLVIEGAQGLHVGAGQWLYLCVPEVSHTQWHPFSLASCSADETVELQVWVLACFEGSPYSYPCPYPYRTPPPVYAPQ
jgi:hypothetical protein